jgi:hypothetical protein
MAHLLTCIAGFNAPARQGRYEIVGASAAVDDTAAASELCIIDDPDINQSGKAGRILASLPTNQKGVLCYQKGLANGDGFLEWIAPEPIKTIYGTSLIFENLKPGTVCIYVR